jgi:hypothetical protein
MSSSRVKQLIKAALTFIEHMRITFSGSDLSFNNSSGLSLKGIKGDIVLLPDTDHQEGLICRTLFSKILIAEEAITECAVTAFLTTDGEIKLTKINGNYFEGSVHGALSFNSQFTHMVSYDMHIDSMNLTTWYQSHGNTGKMEGALTARFKGGRSPLRVQIPRGSVQCTLSHYSLSQLPLLSAFSSGLGIPSLSMLQFDRCAISAEADSGDTVAATFYGTGKELIGNAQGWINKQGHFEYTIEGEFPEKMVNRLSKMVRNSLPATKSGGRTFKCRVYGTFADPRFELDKKIVERAIETMFEDISREYMQMY